MCASCSKSLEAGGIKTTNLEYLYFDDSTHTEAVPYMPRTTFRAIIDNNSRGINIRKNGK